MLQGLKQRAHNLHSQVYDLLIVGLTSEWYRQVLLRIPSNSSVLDVGIGTATSLIQNRDIVLSRGLTVVGVDYEKDYVDFARKNLATSTLRDVVKVEHASIFDYNTDYADKFDAIYFSGSFMIIPNKVDALRHTARMLNPPPRIDAEAEKRSSASHNPAGGNIFFTQTFENDNLIGRYYTPWLKWMLKMTTTVDYGDVVFEKDFRSALAEAGAEIVEVKTMSYGTNRRFVLVVARWDGREKVKG